MGFAPRVLLLLTLLPLAGCILGKGGDGLSASSPAKDNVKIDLDDRAFEPAEIYVRPASALVFTNRDHVAHLVRAADGAWTLPEVAPGEDAPKSFLAPGRYEFACALHEDMRGVVHVVG